MAPLTPWVSGPAWQWYFELVFPEDPRPPEDNVSRELGHVTNDLFGRINR